MAAPVSREAPVSPPSSCQGHSAGCGAQGRAVHAEGGAQGWGTSPLEAGAGRGGGRGRQGAAGAGLRRHLHFTAARRQSFRDKRARWKMGASSDGGQHRTPPGLLEVSKHSVEIHRFWVNAGWRVLLPPVFTCAGDAG